MSGTRTGHRAEIPPHLWHQLVARAAEEETTVEYQLMQAIDLGLATHDALLAAFRRAGLDVSFLQGPAPSDTTRSGV